MAEVPIAQSSRDCLDLFEQLSAFQVSDTSQQLTQIAVRDEESRFKVWTGNIGAHKSGRSSLQHRLRDASHIREQVAELLNDLSELLTSCLAILNGDVVPWDRAEDASYEEEGEPGTELEQIAINVKDVVDCLLRLSVAIRNPAPHDSFVASGPVDVSHYDPFDIQHIFAKFGGMDDVLVKRLGQAMSRRRQFFSYRKGHHLKLSYGLDKDDVLKDAESTVASSLPNHAKAAKFNAVDEDDVSDAGMSQTSFASSVSDADHIRIPPLPKEAETGPFECPFCYTMITATKRISWKRHVLADLQPYICLSKDCQASSRIFTKRREWALHELENHWKLYPCPCLCGQTFKSKRDCQEHTKKHHPNAIPPNQLDAMISLSSRPREEGGMLCPMCKVTINSAKEYWRHVGRHQEQLAIFTLPSIAVPDDPDEEDEDEDDDVNALRDSDDDLDDKSIQEAEANNLSPDPASEKPPVSTQSPSPPTENSLPPSNPFEGTKLRGYPLSMPDYSLDIDSPSEAYNNISPPPRNVAPGLPRAQAFKRQQSEPRAPQAPDEQRAGSRDPMEAQPPDTMGDSNITSTEHVESWLQLFDERPSDWIPSWEAHETLTSDEHEEQSQSPKPASQPRLITPTAGYQSVRVPDSPTEPFEEEVDIPDSPIVVPEEGDVLPEIEPGYVSGGGIGRKSSTLSGKTAEYQHMNPAELVRYDLDQPSVHQGSRNKTNVSPLVKHFEQLRREFEKERIQERTNTALNEAFREKMAAGEKLLKGESPVTRDHGYAAGSWPSGTGPDVEPAGDPSFHGEGSGSRGRSRTEREDKHESINDSGEDEYFTNKGKHVPILAHKHDNDVALGDKQQGPANPSLPRDEIESSPRSILKTPKAAFPEEPNPIREGVAPLPKDREVKEIPPGAKWTKISLSLVDPEALEIGKERFELRSEWVIVLRVLTKEEIQAYASASVVLRERRHNARARDGGGEEPPSGRHSDNGQENPPGPVEQGFDVLAPIDASTTKASARGREPIRARDVCAHVSFEIVKSNDDSVRWICEDVTSEGDVGPGFC